MSSGAWSATLSVQTQRLGPLEWSHRGQAPSASNGFAPELSPTSCFPLFFSLVSRVCLRSVTSGGRLLQPSMRQPQLPVRQLLILCTFCPFDRVGRVHALTTAVQQYVALQSPVGASSYFIIPAVKARILSTITLCPIVVLTSILPYLVCI